MTATLEMLAVLNDLSQQMREQFDGVNERMDGFETKIDWLDARMNRVESGLGVVDSRTRSLLIRALDR